MERLQDWSAALSKSLGQLVQILLAYLPNVIGAVLLVLAGWLVAHVLRALIRRFGAGLDRVFAFVRQRAGLTGGPLLRWPVSRVVGNVVYWMVVLFFFTVATEVLGVPGFADWLSQLVVYLPRLFTAALLVLIGYLLGGWARQGVTAAALGARLDNAAALGRVVQASIMAFALVLAVGHLGLDVALLVNAITIAVAALLGGAALAFGLGAGPAVANILASHYLQRLYRVGQRVRVGGIEGDILELTPTAVVLDTPAGRALIPARTFTDGPSILVDLDVDDTPTRADA